MGLSKERDELKISTLEMQVTISTLERMLRLILQMIEMILDVVRSRELAVEFQVLFPSAAGDGDEICGDAHTKLFYNSIITSNLNLTL